MPSFLTPGRGITRRTRQPAATYSSTLYYYVVYKEKASGKKHSRNRAQLSEATACSYRAAEALRPRHTRYTSVHFSCAQVRHPLPSRPRLQTQIARKVSSKERKTKCNARCQEVDISVQSMVPAHSNMGAVRAHPRFSLIQNPATSNRKLHFASTQKKQLKSWPCYRLPWALPVLTCLGEKVGFRHLLTCAKTNPLQWDRPQEMRLM